MRQGTQLFVSNIHGSHKWIRLCFLLKALCKYLIDQNQSLFHFKAFILTPAPALAGRPFEKRQKTTRMRLPWIYRSTVHRYRWQPMKQGTRCWGSFGWMLTRIPINSLVCLLTLDAFLKVFLSLHRRTLLNKSWLPCKSWMSDVSGSSDHLVKQNLAWFPEADSTNSWDGSLPCTNLIC